jgi:uncharacterized protein (UPF0548 family)
MIGNHRWMVPPVKQTESLYMPHISIRYPSTEIIHRVIQQQSALPFTYAAVGATATQPPPGFIVDRTRVLLGEGERVFNAAKAAMQKWGQFQLGWARAWPTDTPLEPAQTIAVLGRSMGLWWLNCCRIVYLIEDAPPTRKFGFAYGTLPDHVECGEERFMIEWNPDDNHVWYDILAFSRPNYILTRLGYPLVRMTQKRFARDSAKAMLRAVRLEMT